MSIIALAIAGIVLYSIYESRAPKQQPIRIKVERPEDHRRH